MTAEPQSEPVHLPLPDSAVPKQLPGFHIGKIPCCTVLKDENDKNVLVLNETSTLIWYLCNAEVNVGEMMSLLKESFPDAGEQIAADVYRSLDTFKLYEVIEIPGVEDSA